MRQKLTYPLSAFNYVFRDLSDASHLQVSIPDDTVEWLSSFKGDHARDGFTPQEKLIHKLNHRQLFFMLLRVLLPAEADDAINDVERFEQAKNQCVHAHQFEDAAGWLHKKDRAFEKLADWVVGPTVVTRTAMQRLFELLEKQRPSK